MAVILVCLDRGRLNWQNSIRGHITGVEIKYRKSKQIRRKSNERIWAKIITSGKIGNSKWGDETEAHQQPWMTSIISSLIYWLENSVCWILWLTEIINDISNWNTDSVWSTVVCGYFCTLTAALYAILGEIKSNNHNYSVESRRESKKRCVRCGNAEIQDGSEACITRVVKWFLQFLWLHWYPWRGGDLDLAESTRRGKREGNIDRQYAAGSYRYEMRDDNRAKVTRRRQQNKENSRNTNYRLRRSHPQLTTVNEYRLIFLSLSMCCWRHACVVWCGLLG